MPLVLTSCGVEECPEIDAGQLETLATWLCDKQNYHDKADALAARKITDAAYESFERECRENGGYCSTCRDFAGELLAHFSIASRKETDR